MRGVRGGYNQFMQRRGQQRPAELKGCKDKKKKRKKMDEVRFDNPRYFDTSSNLARCGWCIENELWLTLSLARWQFP